MKNSLFLRKPFKYTDKKTVLIIIFINFLIFGLSYFFPKIFQYLNYYCSLNVINIHENHMYWQFFTYMFMHQNISHVFFNMLGLLFFGLYVEKAVGSKEFVLFYCVCGILSGIFSYAVYFFTGQYYTFLMGASGAIYAVLFAYAVLFPRSIIYIWGIIPVPAPVLVLIYAIIEVVSQLGFVASSNVAHLTHLFGFFAAFLYFVIRMGINPFKVWKNVN